MLEMVTLFPHPPIVLPEVGKKEAAKVSTTYQAMEKLAQEIVKLNPEVIVTVSPHGPVFNDAFTLNALESLQGDLTNYGAPQVKVAFSSAPKEREAVLAECRHNQLFCVPLEENSYQKYNLSENLDQGLVVPLSFLYRLGWRGKLLPVNMAFLPYEELYDFGKCINKALEKLNISWVFLASGDLSHRLLQGASAGYSPRGMVFDEIVRQSVREGDVKRLLNIDPDLVEEAGECGLRPFIMALGVLDGYAIEAEELSYEGPFGVGYMVARLKKGAQLSERRLSAALYQERSERLKKVREGESLPVSIARQSLNEYLTTRQYLQVPENAPELLSTKAGAFVSLKKHGQLRGCIGTIEPTKKNLAAEIIHNAVSAAIQDSRFTPVLPEELEELTITVDVLEKPEKIASLAQLDPQVYGVIVSQGTRRGLLLPDLPGINTPEEQVEIARQKAGIDEDTSVELARFKVTRFV